MRSRTVGEVKVLVPDLTVDDLTAVADEPDDDLHDRHAVNVDWTGLELAGAHLTGCLFTGVSLADARWRRVALIGCVLERVDLSSAMLSDVTLERCQLVGCRLSGLRLRESTLKHVLFDDCRLDYAQLDSVRATGPVAFAGCSLTQARFTACRLPRAVVHDCRLANLELDGCDLHGADLRGSPLLDITGLSSLRGALIEPSQVTDLAQVAVRDLGLAVRDC